MNYDVKETLFVPFTIVKFKHLVIQRVVLLDGLSSIKSESIGRAKDDKKKGLLASSKTWENHTLLNQYENWQEKHGIKINPA